MPEQITPIRPGRLGPGADDGGVWLASADDEAVDVLIDGRRIWSFNPARAAAPDSNMFRVPWPDALRPYLDGIAQVEVREHASGRVLFDEKTQFGDSTAALRIEDTDGHPLVINKKGKIKRSFAERDPAAVEAMMRATEAALSLIRDAGYPAFLAYGTLLGAVREGGLIGHDDDIDLGFLAPSPFPVDAARASFRLERLFRRAGWRTWRYSAADFKVGAKGVRGPGKWIDIFGGFFADGTFYLMANLTMPAEQVKLEPLSEVQLEGRTLPAPADPTWLLEAWYGPGWRVPDPSFKVQKSQETMRRTRSWMRGAIANRNYWYAFYGSGYRDVPTEPSAFATWFADREPSGARVVDIGCGNGRDSVWFAERGYDVLGLDYAPAAVHRARAAARAGGADARFSTFNLLDTRHVLALGGLLSHEAGPVHLYARFLLHAVPERGRHNLWLLARTCLRRGGRLYLEFLARERGAERVEHVFGPHFRLPLRPFQVAAEIRDMGGQIEHREVGHGLAVYQHEDPNICRMVVSWPGKSKT